MLFKSYLKLVKIGQNLATVPNPDGPEGCQNYNQTKRKETNVAFFYPPDWSTRETNLMRIYLFSKGAILEGLEVDQYLWQIITTLTK